MSIHVSFANGRQLTVLEFPKSATPNPLIEELPIAVDGISWATAEADLRDLFAEVSAADLRLLVERFGEGRIDGQLPQMTYKYGRFCGCFVATIGHAHGVDDDEDWRAFEKTYGTIDTLTPFQVWLLLVRSGNTPANNPVAARFVEVLVAMIDERNHEHP